MITNDSKHSGEKEKKKAAIVEGKNRDNP